MFTIGGLHVNLLSTLQSGFWEHRSRARFVVERGKYGRCTYAPFRHRDNTKRQSETSESSSTVRTPTAVPPRWTRNSTRWFLCSALLSQSPRSLSVFRACVSCGGLHDLEPTVGFTKAWRLRVSPVTLWWQDRETPTQWQIVRLSIELEKLLGGCTRDPC